MRSLSLWALCLSFAACVAQPGSFEAPVELGSQVEALALGDCSPAALDDALTWSSRASANEACDGPFSYLHYKTCVATDPSCPQVCARHQTCRDWSFGADSVRLSVSSSSTLTVPGVCRTLCNGRVGGSCEEPEVVCTAPAAGTLTARCSEAAETYRQAHYNTAPTIGTVAASSALPASFTRIGETRNYRGPCSFTVSVPQPAARAAAPCACATFGNGSCRVTGPACGSERVRTGAGLDPTQARALVLTDATALPLRPRRGEAGADLSCTTCEDLPLPSEAERDLPAAREANEQAVQAKFQCLQSRLPPDGPTRLSGLRNLVLLYETWGEFLDVTTSDELSEAYARYDELPDLDQCDVDISRVALPLLCKTQKPIYEGHLIRCQRLLHGEHVSLAMRHRGNEFCNSALTTFRRLPQDFQGCTSAAYDALLSTTVDKLQPAWDYGKLGSLHDPEPVEGNPRIVRTLVGWVPPGYTCIEIDEHGWKGGFLFQNRPAGSQPVGRDGEVFCRYRYEGLAADLDYSRLPVYGRPCVPGTSCARKYYHGLEWLRPDDTQLTEQAPTFPVFDDVAARLRVEYLNAVDAPLALTGAPRRQVDLAILDGLPDSGEDDVTPVLGAGHGRALAVAAYRMACPGPAPCPIRFRSYRAFSPRTVASLSELAETIVRAVDDAERRQTKLVLNISLGLHPALAYWDRPDPPGTPPENASDYPLGTLLPAFRALQAALNYASAHGVITVAASGNSDGDDAVHDAHAPDRSNELLYPAAFDGTAGWDCDRARTCVPSRTRSLVIAAGGITHQNEPLPNTRLTDREVPFVAPACNVVVDNDLPGQAGQAPLQNYCGTSFGAIGVSAVIAATWAYASEDAPGATLELVRRSSVDTRLGGPCVGGDCRVRMCAALAEADAAVQCGTRRTPSLVAANVDAFVQSQGQSVAWEGANSSDLRDLACDTDLVFAGAHNADSCPSFTYENAVPKTEILRDQPPASRCPHCVVILRSEPSPDDEAVPYLVGHLEGSSEEVSSPTLKIGGRSYELGSTLAPLLSSGGSFAIPLLPDSNNASGVASLSYMKTDPATGVTTAHVDPLPVLR